MNSKNRGFTLIELMIAMAVGMVVLGAVYALVNVQSKQLQNNEQIAELHQNARMALEMMVREISMAGYNQTTSPTITAVPRCTDASWYPYGTCAGITYVATSYIGVTADLNGNGSVTTDSSNPSENIWYYMYWSGSGLVLGRWSNGTLSPVVDNIEDLSLQYYNASGALTWVRENMRKVKITLRFHTAKPDPSYTDPTYGDHYRRYTLSSFAVPRNLALSN